MNILIVGDSVSDIEHCGMLNARDKIWHSFIPAIHNITNLSMGGQSNLKIFSKTCIELIKNPNHYDLVIVQWTSLFRLSLNVGKSIYDNQVNLTVSSVDSKFKKFHQMWADNFCHLRIDLLEFLSYINVLATLLKEKNIKFIFIKTANNCLTELENSIWQECSSSFLENVLHLSALPDNVINGYFQELKSVYTSMVNLTSNHWLNLYTSDWVNMSCDYADDGKHPGLKSHKIFYTQFINFTKSLELQL